MRHVYFVLSLGIVTLGVIHIAATPKLFSHLTSGALWFASGGLVLMLTGAFNLLRRAYGAIAYGLTLVCVITNVLMTGFALLQAYVTGASALQFVMVVGLMASATVLSVLPASQLHHKSQTIDGGQR
jgi:hypothetical protein